MTNEKKVKLFARVDPVVVRRVKREATQRFQGNESMVVREALETYLLLRERLGPQYDAYIGALLTPTNGGS